eukprot:Partr_v1_DN25066_c0_g1_i1_m50998 putative PARK2 co-regulated
MQPTQYVTSTRVAPTATRHTAPRKKPAAASAAPRRQISAFRKLYDRGDFPACVNYDARGQKIKWKVDPATLDYHYYLPLFFTGLLETRDPYRFIVWQGIHDMISLNEDKVIATIPQLILPIKVALNTSDPKVLVKVMTILQDLVAICPKVGPALVPYYRQLLPVFNQFKNRNVHLGDGIYYGQRKSENLGQVIDDTLNKLEKSGGQNSLANIKYMVPTYESCIVRH